MFDRYDAPRKHQKVWALFTSIVVLAMLLSGCGGAPKVYRVGVLAGFEGAVPIAQAFMDEMTNLGYAEGKNIVYDVQVANFDEAAYQTILQKFVDDKVDLIFVSPTEPLFTAKAITEGTNIPVVFSFGLIEGSGLVNSVREPGGNITGVQYPGSDLTVKRFEVLQQLAPDAKRVWIPYQRGVQIVITQMDAIRPLAEAAGITLIEFPADDAAEVQAELDRRSAAADTGIDAIMFVTEPLSTTSDVFTVISDFAHEHHILFGGTDPVSTELNPVYEVNPDPLEAGRLAAPLADKILSGVPAGTIPIVTPNAYIRIWLSVAEELGVTVPEGLLRQAAEIIP
jgi:putative ABC transport system substrate-binding protein